MFKNIIFILFSILNRYLKMIDLDFLFYFLIFINLDYFTTNWLYLIGINHSDVKIITEITCSIRYLVLRFYK